ncbi:hypothetical protein OS493_002537 [Desmophyllum pertusum]|uniref:Myosin motor domain-containing protein n=1 Tax=Desmophyllum pertusum TaxID=174260 RepID=A0A9X0CMX3_9CNID|nr:hypothetical protein OS493_002537 [Desmophyllum pertusum]
MAKTEKGCVDDLATLSELNEEIILQELQARYKQDVIYTYVGDILIALNPFKRLEIYHKNAAERYKMTQKSIQPPHIFAIADSAYQAMLGVGGASPKSQCCVISGESGAGKTESAKLLISQLVELSRGTSQLEQQILQVNPLLEAFGNAQTLMNDNSSRFGKYIQLKFQQGPWLLVLRFLNTFWKNPALYVKAVGRRTSTFSITCLLVSPLMNKTSMD